MLTDSDKTYEKLHPYLFPTSFIDSSSLEVMAFARSAIEGVDGEVDKAVALYYRVRDGIWYDPYSIRFKPEYFKASNTIQAGHGICINKSVLLAAVARAVGIPSRLGFADVRNHLSTPRLLELMGTDIFYFHGYTDLFLEGKWVKATPAFNLGLCEKFRVLPLEFNGREDSIFHQFDLDNRLHMEYLRYREPCADLPYDELVREMAVRYPKLVKMSKENEGGEF